MAAAGVLEGVAGHGVAVDDVSDDAVGVGDGAFVGALLEVGVDVAGGEDGDEGFACGVEEVEEVGGEFAAFEGCAPVVGELFGDGLEGGLCALAGDGAFEAADGG